MSNRCSALASGISSGRFDPGAPVQRDQMATLLARLCHQLLPAPTSLARWLRRVGSVGVKGSLRRPAAALTPTLPLGHPQRPSARR